MSADVIKVLVAEDEPAIRSIFQAVLESRGDCEFELAEDGQEALTKLHAHHPDLLITDLRMPYMGGEELISRALEMHPYLTVLVETGNPSLDGAVQLFRGGAFDFITKPFIMADLQNSIERAVQESRIRRQRKSVDIIVESLMTALEAKDPYLKGHCKRVSLFTRCLGQDLGITNSELGRLEWAALVHDLGKIGISDVVLHKEGKLDPEEFEEMKSHANHSADIIRPLAHLKGGDEAVEAVFHHHERMDGRGYPHGLSGTNIPLHARIITVCDAYDAMTSNRPYRDAMQDDTARQRLLADAGVQFDASLVELFTRNLKTYKNHVLAANGNE